MSWSHIRIIYSSEGLSKNNTATNVTRCQRYTRGPVFFLAVMVGKHLGEIKNTKLWTIFYLAGWEGRKERPPVSQQQGYVIWLRAKKKKKKMFPTWYFTVPPTQSTTTKNIKCYRENMEQLPIYRLVKTCSFEYERADIWGTWQQESELLFQADCLSARSSRSCPSQQRNWQTVPRGFWSSFQPLWLFFCFLNLRS